jgi:hypothetical protein
MPTKRVLVKPVLTEAQKAERWARIDRQRAWSRGYYAGKKAARNQLLGFLARH